MGNAASRRDYLWRARLHCSTLPIADLTSIQPKVTSCLAVTSRPCWRLHSCDFPFIFNTDTSLQFITNQIRHVFSRWSFGALLEFVCYWQMVGATIIFLYLYINLPGWDLYRVCYLSIRLHLTSPVYSCFNISASLSFTFSAQKIG